MALSNIGVFGNGVGNFLLNVRRRHPREDKPLIDWELVTLMEPSTVAGAVFAGYLNKVSAAPTQLAGVDHIFDRHTCACRPHELPIQAPAKPNQLTPMCRSCQYG